MASPNPAGEIAGNAILKGVAGVQATGRSINAGVGAINAGANSAKDWINQTGAPAVGQAYTATSNTLNSWSGPASDFSNASLNTLGTWGNNISNSFNVATSNLSLNPTINAAGNGVNYVQVAGTNTVANVQNSTNNTVGWLQNTASNTGGDISNAVAGARDLQGTFGQAADTAGGYLFDAGNVIQPKVTKTINYVANTNDGKRVISQVGQMYDNTTGSISRAWDILSGKEHSVKGGGIIPKRTPPVPPPVNTTREGSDAFLFATPAEMAKPEALYTDKGKSQSYDANPERGLDTAIEGQSAYFSLFNDWSLMKYQGGVGVKEASIDAMNQPVTFDRSSLTRNPTVQTIIEKTREMGSASYQYRYFDFALAKFNGRIPNNYLVTLRRFPMPIEDNIISKKMEGTKITPEKGLPALAQAVTWFGESTGNQLTDILKFKVSQNWEAIKSELQTIDSGGEGGKVQSMIGSKPLLGAIWGAANGLDAAGLRAAQSGHDPLTDTYPNHVFGPINVIKEIAVRQAGLEFSNDITLVFEYDLRQIKGVNPKIAFLDLMANLLALTYNNGAFWGGAVRYTGGGKINKPMGDQSKLKSGDYAGFFKSIMDSALGGLSNIVNDVRENGLLGSNVAKNFIGGKLMDMFGSPQGGQAVKAFLSGEATGDMHIVVGNPLNPIAVMGNMYCAGADFAFDGEMSYDGFPTQLKVTIELKHARPRDKADIESMFNGGKGRMYLQPQKGINMDRPFIASAYGNKDKAGDFTNIEKLTAG